ncbi:NO-inducible flavohemoprotein [Alkalicoccus halolimnae]|uniref:Flavohemoprotein n=1 Tax=Alkalicoccus halolimnae TaxID=1667239 RepID=A0A5C7FGV3_9BACI|nr:NO-inducible flavohemoprotein [Alkalicoccus halolimnae]TXF82772.1 NO-inducible flavohemoprotein [Alkalicoccus halolimnae]
MLTNEQMTVITSTVPVLEEHGVKVTTRFYRQLFNDHPELLNLFNHVNQETGDQPKALAYSLYQAASNIENLESILPVVKQIAHKHRSIGVKEEHYPIVGEYLLQAMQDELGLNSDDPVIEAWGAAYGIIADVFIQVEKEMYEQAGWDGFREMKVSSKVRESDEIYSFYFSPADGGPLPLFQPGQYISIEASIPGEKYRHIRQYSLSDAPGKNHYRISVKRENNPEGIVSNYLHDQVNAEDSIYISAPAGDFTVKEAHSPLILISGGVGVTPLLSMYKRVRESQPERPVTFVQAVRNENVHGLAEEIHVLKEDSHIRHIVCYEEPENIDAGDFKGRLTPEALASFLPQEQAEYYLCGPELFMQSVYDMLKDLGISSNQISYEFFGPTMTLVENK